MRLARVESHSGVVVTNIESPTPGVVLIDVHVVGRTEGVPLHWRIGTWTKPPLDIRLDRDGRLIGFQFVLQDERVPEAPTPDLPIEGIGLPIFDVEDWHSDGYLDQTSDVTAHRLAGLELLLGVQSEQIGRHVYRVAPDLAMAFADDGRLAEIRLGPLSLEDWGSIDAFSHTGR